MNNFDMLEGLPDNPRGEMVGLEITAHIESHADLVEHRDAIGRAIFGMAGQLTLLAGRDARDTTRSAVVLVTARHAFTLSPRMAERLAKAVEAVEPAPEIAPVIGMLGQCAQEAREGLHND